MPKLVSKILICVIINCLFCILCNAQHTSKTQGHRQSFRIAELNCENLFDTIHDEGFNDYEFLPTSKHLWNTPRYWSKLTKLSREIASLGNAEPIDLIALIEIENDTVLRDLTTRTKLNRLNYHYIISHGIDPRGIDVALLYQEGGFKPLSINTLRLGNRISPTLLTRDVLHVKGRARSGDTLDVFVCHMPSKVGGLKSENNRSKIAHQLRLCIDSICIENPRANIIIIGDFNDSPLSKSITQDLGAKPTILAKKKVKHHKHKHHAEEQPFTPQHATLYNLATKPKDPKEPQGTYSYRGEWEILDQCIVNERLTNPKNHLHVAKNPYHIVTSRFLLEKDLTYGGFKPLRTYQGTFYKGGFSDHLPIIIEFEF